MMDAPARSIFPQWWHFEDEGFASDGVLTTPCSITRLIMDYSADFFLIRQQVVGGRETDVPASAIRSMKI